MTSNQFCKNHPLVTAIDQCVSCSTSICGMCANFADGMMFCEGCLENHEADKLVKAKKAKMDLPKSAAYEAETEETQFTPPTNSKINFRAIRLGFCFLAIVALAWSLYSYNQPTNLPRAAEIVQLERMQAELIQCLAVFAEIGQQLSNGGGPAAELRCRDTTLSNRVLSGDEELRVAHPNPRFYGAKAIYVTDKNPIPIVEPLDP